MNDVPPPLEPDDDRPVRDFNHTPLQTIELDEHPEYDAADITSLETLDEEGHGYALTVFIQGLYDTGPHSFVEPDSWEVDEKLRKLVLEESLVPEHRLRLEPLPSATIYLGDDPDDFDGDLEFDEENDCWYVIHDDPDQEPEENPT